MTDHNANVSWRDLREFAGVDLAKSFILSWHVEAETLVIDIDLYLEPEHPFYETPRPAEKVCIRAAYIEFPYCDILQQDGEEAGKPVDIVEDLEHGAIAELAVVDEGRYALSGDFGTVFVSAGRPVLRLTGS